MNIFDERPVERKRPWRMPSLGGLFDKYWLWAAIILSVSCTAFVLVDTDWAAVRANLDQPVSHFTKGEMIALAVLAAMLARK